VRRGVIPPKFGSPYIPFNRADPIYGGKVMKTSIVNGCNCPIVSDNSGLLYRDSAEQDKILAVKYQFNVGDYVWARKVGDVSGELYKATITAITNGLFIIKFEDGTIETVSSEYISIYYDCNGCISTSTTTKFQLYTLDSETGTTSCTLLSSLSDGQLI
jgi:outer membrane protein assembly factor BamB